MFQFPCITSLYYIRNQQDATLAVSFISNCKITLHVSDVHRVHHQEYKNCSSSHWCMGRDDVYPVETSKVGSLLHYVIAYPKYAMFMYS
jgi:hypothetical protein